MGGAAGVAGHDDGHPDLAHHRVGTRGDHHLHHLGMRRHHRFDLERVHVVAAPDVHLLGPAGESQAAGGVDEPEVAAVHPPVADGVGRGLGSVPVAAQLRGGAEADLSDDACLDRSVVLVTDLQLDAGTGPSDGEQRLVVAGIEGGRRAHPAGLGRGVADRVRGADAGSGFVHERRWRQRTAHDDGLHGREVVVVEVGLSQQEGELRRDPADAGHALLARSSAARRPPASGRSGAGSWPAAGTTAAWS